MYLKIFIEGILKKLIMVFFWEIDVGLKDILYYFKYKIVIFCIVLLLVILINVDDVN